MVKKAKTKAQKQAAASGRLRQLSKKQAKQKAKKEVSSRTPIPNSFKVTGQVFRLFKANWKVLGGVLLVYTVLNLILATGLLSNLYNSVGDIRHNHHFSDALSGYGSLIGGSSGAQTGSIMQSVLLILESLAIIWALRQLVAREKISVKQTYYQSMAPLVPFLLVVLFIILQLLPLTLGSVIATLVLSAALVNSTLVSIVFIGIFILLAAWSIYMVSTSIFALYIVTLPDMQPRQALRSAKKLVKFRRWTVLRKLLYLAIFMFLVTGLITVAFIVSIPILAVPVFFLVLMLAIMFFHGYMYSLYRSLIA